LFVCLPAADFFLLIPAIGRYPDASRARTYLRSGPGNMVTPAETAPGTPKFKSLQLMFVPSTAFVARPFAVFLHSAIVSSLRFAAILATVGAELTNIRIRDAAIAPDWKVRLFFCDTKESSK
jgi:hypothetical protein